MRKNKTLSVRFFGLTFILAFIALTTACGKPQSPKQNTGSHKSEIVLDSDNKEEPGETDTDTTEEDDEEEERIEKPAEDKRIEVKAVVLNNCTGIGFAPVMGWNAKDKSNEKYTLEVVENGDKIAEKLKDGSADVALMPLTDAVKLYNSDKNIVILATNTYNNMYIADTTGKLTNKTDLNGAEIAYADDGSLTSCVAKKIIENCKAQGKPYASNEEIQAGLIDGSIVSAIVPEPYITLAKMSNDAVEMGPEIPELWSAVDKSEIISSVFVARREFVQNNADSIPYIMDDFSQSVNTVKNAVTKTLEWSEEANIVPDRSLAVSTMKNCDFRCNTGSEMRLATDNFLFANKDMFSEEVPDYGLYYVNGLDQ